MQILIASHCNIITCKYCKFAGNRLINIFNSSLILYSTIDKIANVKFIASVKYIGSCDIAICCCAQQVSITSRGTMDIFYSAPSPHISILQNLFICMAALYVEKRALGSRLHKMIDLLLVE